MLCAAIIAPQDFAADNTPDTPSLEDLHTALAASDRWTLIYLETVTPELLSESVRFVFTDGDKGCLSREGPVERRDQSGFM